MSERLEILNRLREATNAVLRAIDRPVRISLQGEAVNWADLNCSSAEYRLDDTGHTYYAVSVEEVSPEADGFAAYVKAELEKAGWPGILVETEW
jgi:hypothetical protein